MMLLKKMPCQIAAVFLCAFPKTICLKRIGPNQQLLTYFIDDTAKIMKKHQKLSVPQLCSRVFLADFYASDDVFYIIRY